MFFGEYRHQLDEKYRFRIPAKLKEQLGDNPFIMRGPNNCIIILKNEDADKMLKEQSSGIDILDPKNNFSLRMLTSSAFFADEDKQGRVTLPAKLLEHAKIKEKNSENINRNIVTIGVYNRIEMWCEEIWDKLSDMDSETFDESLENDLKAKRGQV